MKLNLSVPGNPNQRLLFSNIDSPNPESFYLLMTFHKSKKGGFDYPVTVDQCKEALKKKKLKYFEGDII
jgi:hypothetical protein